MTDKPHFSIPGEFLDSTPFERMDFWVWANAQKVRENVTMENYLAHLGFVLNEDRISEETFERLHFAEDTWHRTAPRLKGRHKLSDLFTPNENGFQVYGQVGSDPLFNGKVEPVAELRDALSRTMIYDITPQNIYFEVIRTTAGKLRLVAKYSGFLGSRIAAELEG